MRHIEIRRAPGSRRVSTAPSPKSGIDAYASTVTKQVPLFEKTDLAAGPHTIRVVCTGTKNAASSGTTCALDAFASIAFPIGTPTTRCSTRASDRNVANRRWTLVSAENGYDKIKNVNSNKLLSASSAGTQLVQSTDTNAGSQLWKVVNVD